MRMIVVADNKGRWLYPNDLTSEPVFLGDEDELYGTRGVDLVPGTYDVADGRMTLLDDDDPGPRDDTADDDDHPDDHDPNERDQSLRKGLPTGAAVHAPAPVAVMQKPKLPPLPDDEELDENGQPRKKKPKRKPVFTAPTAAVVQKELFDIGTDRDPWATSRHRAMGDSRSLWASMKKRARNAPIAQNARNDDTAFEMYVPITKVDKPKRMVYGFATVSTHPDGRPYFDTEGHHIPVGVIQKAFHTFMIQKRAGGLMHERTNAGHIVEGIIVDADTKGALGIPADSPDGLFIGYKVGESEAKVWDDVKMRKLRGFSIGGNGRLRKLAA